MITRSPNCSACSPATNHGDDVDQVTFNTRCAQLARERGLDWREMTFDQKAAIRAELDHLLPKPGPERGLSRDGLPHRVNDPRAPGLVATYMGGPSVRPIHSLHGRRRRRPRLVLLGLRRKRSTKNGSPSSRATEDGIRRDLTAAKPRTCVVS